MAKKPPANVPRITPYLYYEDVGSALVWLARVFGFRGRVRMPGPDGKVMHGEVYVDDVDAHYRRAKEAGVTIKQDPADQFYGDRTYCAEDPEGHVWYFAQHVRDVAPEDMKP